MSLFLIIYNIRIAYIYRLQCIGLFIQLLYSFQIQATDEDTGENGRIEYIFPSIVGDRDRKIFALSRDTGSITIKNSTLLDYETKKVHHLTVEAKDMGPNPSPAYTTVFVHVQDVNDNRPEFWVTYLEGSFIRPSKNNANYDEIIMENIDVGEFFAFVTITDKDEGVNGSVTSKLQDNSAFSFERVDDAGTRCVYLSNCF